MGLPVRMQPAVLGKIWGLQGGDDDKKARCTLSRDAFAVPTRCYGVCLVQFP